MTPSQIESMSALAESLTAAVAAVTDINAEIKSIEETISSHRSHLDDLFDRERDLRRRRTGLIEAMEKAQSGLEAFEAAMPGDEFTEELEAETTGLDPFMGAADVEDDAQPGTFPNQNGSMADDLSEATEPGVMMQEASANLAEAAEAVDAPVETVEDLSAAESMLAELDAESTAEDEIEGYSELVDAVAEKVDDSFVTVEELAAMSDDLVEADVEAAAEVIDATNDIIGDRAAAIAQDAAGQVANSGKFGE